MGDEEVAKYPGLSTRDESGVWYFRKRIPVDLVHLYDRPDVRESLDTKDKAAAIRKYLLLLRELNEEFEAHRERIGKQARIEQALSAGNLEMLTHAEIEHLLLDWWNSRKSIQADQTQSDDEGEPDREGAIVSDLERLMPDAQHAAETIAEAAQQVLREVGFRSSSLKVGRISTVTRYPLVDQSGPRFAYLCDLVGRALRIEGALALDRVRGTACTPHDPLLNPIAPTLELPLPAQAVSDARKTVSAMLKAFRKEREVRFGVESTARKYGLLFRAIEECLGGDYPAERLSRSDFIRVFGFIRRLPPNSTKIYPGKSLTDIIAIAEEGGLRSIAPNTLSSYAQNLKAVFNWGHEQGWCNEIKMRGVVPRRKAEVKRRGFKPEELHALFSSLKEFRNTVPSRYWVPAIAVYSGARLGEICQLRVGDVQSVQGIYCLNLSEYDEEGQRVEDKQLKNEASERFVPLHNELLKSGFMSLVEGRNPKDRIFSELKAGKDRTYSHAFSKWFGQFKRKCGFTSRALVFHSFRHGFRDACRLASITDETAMALGGWKRDDQASKYGNMGMVPVLESAMKKIGYEGFSLGLPFARARQKISPRSE